MERAREAVGGFLNKHGHTTEVDEQVQPAVTQEEIKPTRHEEITTAVDRETHQHHYHTTVQPVTDKQILPEQHTHQALPVQEKQFEHGDRAATEARLAEEAGQFRDTSVTAAVRETRSEAPTQTGEHVHHHVHENVIPVINKETIQPEVIHTTQQIHEVHTAPSEHHGMSTLPTKSLNEFQQIGGVLTGQNTAARETYEGDPRPYNPELQTIRNEVDKNPGQHDGLHNHGAHGHHHGQQGQQGLGGSGTTGTGSGTGALGGGRATDTVDSFDPRLQSERNLGQGTGVNTGAGVGQTNFGSNTSTGLDSQRPAFGSGIGGVAAGTAAADLARDHTTAGNNTNFGHQDSDTTGRDLQSGGLTGTALGGRMEGNTGPGATRAYDDATSNTGNMGTSNMGTSNMGTGNMGTGNMGTGNMGTGNMGTGNMGTGNMGTTDATGGVGRSFGGDNYNTGNMGTGNMGTTNTTGGVGGSYGGDSYNTGTMGTTGADYNTGSLGATGGNYNTGNLGTGNLGTTGTTSNVGRSFGGDLPDGNYNTGNLGTTDTTSNVGRSAGGDNYNSSIPSTLTSGAGTLGASDTTGNVGRSVGGDNYDTGATNTGGIGRGDRTDETTTGTGGRGFNERTDPAQASDAQQASRNVEASGGNKQTSVPDDGQQHASQGKDPATEGDTSKVEMKGTGQPGSHSAVFGLTPDGKKYTDTSSKTTAPKPAHSSGNDDQKASIPEDPKKERDINEKGTGSEGVAEQLNNPKVHEKGHGGDEFEPSGRGQAANAAGDSV